MKLWDYDETDVTIRNRAYVTCLRDLLACLPEEDKLAVHFCILVD